MRSIAKPCDRLWAQSKQAANEAEKWKLARTHSGRKLISEHSATDCHAGGDSLLSLSLSVASSRDTFAQLTSGAVEEREQKRVRFLSRSSSKSGGENPSGPSFIDCSARAHTHTHKKRHLYSALFHARCIIPVTRDISLAAALPRHLSACQTVIARGQFPQQRQKCVLCGVFSLSFFLRRQISQKA
jgi:hypothetical protein